MQRIELEVQQREKGNLNQQRRAGLIPAVLYGQGESVSVTLDAKVFNKAIHTKAGVNALFTFKYGADKNVGIVKSIQRDIFTQKPIHVDLLRINVKEKIEVNVPVHVVGEAPGVKTHGGILEHIQREIRVRCLPDDIPASIDVDVSKLEIGHGIKVGDITPAQGVEFVTAGDHIVVNIVAPKVEEEVKPAGGVAEPEVIAKGKKDEEGAAAAAGTAAPAAGAAAPKAGAAAPAKEEKKK